MWVLTTHYKDENKGYSYNFYIEKPSALEIAAAYPLMFNEKYADILFENNKVRVGDYTYMLTCISNQI